MKMNEEKNDLNMSMMKSEKKSIKPFSLLLISIATKNLYFEIVLQCYVCKTSEPRGENIELCT